MREVVLSKRLEALCRMVTPGKCVVDVGCDHGFVSIYLVQKGISPRVLAMDVRKGPLSRAQEHIAECGLGDYIETRLSDGLLEFQDGAAQSLVCAGMGGRLMTRILTDSFDKVRKLDELILQPQSELPEFRNFLKERGFVLLDEEILCEEGKYYFLMKVRYCGLNKESAVLVRDRALSGAYLQDTGKAGAVKEDEERLGGRGFVDEKLSEDLIERYGVLLLQRRHPVLKEYLEESLKNLQQIEATLTENENERARNRLEEIRVELKFLRQALDLF